MNFVANSKKIIQRRSYDFLSQKYSVLLISLILFSFLITVIQFGEVWLQWSREKYEVAFNPYSDNVIKKSLQNKLCQHVPIDVVYTWVNGSDPLLMKSLQDYEDQLLEETSKLCPHAHCLPSHIVTARLPEDEKQKKYNKKMGHLWNKESLQNVVVEKHLLNRTVIYFSSPEEAFEAVKQTLMAKKANVTLYQAHWTTDQDAPGAYPMQNTLVISSIPPEDVDDIEYRIRITFHKVIGDAVLNVWTYSDKRIAVVELNTTETAGTIMEQFKKNNILAGTKVNISHAYIINELPFGDPENFSPSRFEDKEELRYSLRSLEKFAPWVRHVYLVTNGQIPHWLNLDNPRLTLITHDQIFSDLSHLPTFSSPAIEAHIHRIAGLSDKFLYFNDDVMLGREVWPEDFITYSNGQKVYFSWSVPDCSDLCPWSWVNDGSCDVACNTSDCFYDGGDCNLGNEDAGSNDGMMTYDENNQSIDTFNDDVFEGQLGFRDNDNNPFNHINYFAGTEKQNMKENKDAITEIHNISERGIHGEVNVGVSKDDLELKTINIEHEVAYTSVNQSHTSELIITVPTSAQGNTVSNRTTTPFHKTTDFGRFKSSKTRDLFDFSHVLNEKNMNNKYDNGFHISNSSYVQRRNISISLPTKDNNHILNLHELKNSYRSSKARRQLYLKRHVKDLIDHKWKFFGKYRGANRTNIGTDAFHTAERRKVLQERINSVNATEASRNKHRNKKQSAYRMHYQTLSGKKLRDTFAESLLYVNRIYNNKFGFQARKVPAHMPHLIDKNIMEDLQRRFPKEWILTSSHKIRSVNDMQYAFSYFYFLMSEKQLLSASDIFDIFDTDKSGTLSDREIRTLLTRLYELPLAYQRVIKFEEQLINCSKMLPKEMSQLEVPTPMYERYQDSKLSVVSKPLVVNCEPIVKLLSSKFGWIKRYKYEVVKEKYQDIAFKMLSSNLSQLISVLDEVRKEPKKFICLNDNLKPSHDHDNALIRAVLQDFYEALFPAPSSFELPPVYRNRFLHISELEAWRANRNTARVFVYFCFVLLFSFTLFNFLQIECRSWNRRTATNGNSTRQRTNLQV